MFDATRFVKLNAGDILMIINTDVFVNGRKELIGVNYKID